MIALSSTKLARHNIVEETPSFPPLVYGRNKHHDVGWVSTPAGQLGFYFEFGELEASAEALAIMNPGACIALVLSPD